MPGMAGTGEARNGEDFMLTVDQVVEKLITDIKRAGTQAAWARENGVSQSYLHDVIHRKRRPGAKILSALSLTSIRAYAKIKA